MSNSFITKMYSGSNQPVPDPASTKNPNRVAGGLRAQGVDTLTILGEDGQEREIPSQKYIQSLEDKLRKQESAINVLERKINRLQSEQQQLTNTLRR